MVRRTIRGIMAAIRARPIAFGIIALAVFLLDLFLPVVVLSLARKPWDYFAFNAWLSRLPEYLASSEVPLRQKAGFLWRLALFWFVADGPYGAPEWGFAVSVGDLVRFGYLSLLFGAYFALWLHRRDRLLAYGKPQVRLGQHAGTFGALASVLGLSTGPCSVVGCGAPVLPVVGLAFVGLSSGTLALLTQVSKWATAALLLGMTLAVAYLGWRAGAGPTDAGAGDRGGRP